MFPERVHSGNIDYLILHKRTFFLCGLPWAPIQAIFSVPPSFTRYFVVYGVVAILGIFILLTMAFRSIQAAAVVMVNLPLALIGGQSFCRVAF